MSSSSQSSPKTPGIPMRMVLQNGNREPESKPSQNGSQNAGIEPMAKSTSLAICEASDGSPVSSKPASIKPSQCSVEMEDVEQAETAITGISEDKSESLQDLEPFDWNNFEARYNEAMAKANEAELALIKEFHDTAQYFRIWTTSASRHDDDRAMKRLKTRETYIQQAESSLGEKRDHYFQVVEAFRKALELLTSH